MTKGLGGLLGQNIVVVDVKRQPEFIVLWMPCCQEGQPF